MSVMPPIDNLPHSAKAALRGEPSYIWRAGQDRRLQMILDYAGGCLPGRLLDNGCGVGTYLDHLSPYVGTVVGLDFEHERVIQAHRSSELVLCSAGEHLPFPTDTFDLVLSHEVLEHVQDDRLAVREIVRVLKPGGRLMLFCPNRGYPFETHGIYWRGKYHFGNIPLVNYLPRSWRDRLAPHVNVYTSHNLERLFDGLPVRYIERRIIFGAYDNVIARNAPLGHFLRSVMMLVEKTPLQIFGLSHFWVVEKTPAN
jgi:SAM-dependent methyltransferase